MKYKIPDKCKTCDMPEEYRPEHPGTCGVCYQNKEADTKLKLNLEFHKALFIALKKAGAKEFEL